MKLKRKIYYTFLSIMMKPMLKDDPKSTVDSAKLMFWKTLKDIWTNKIDLDK